MNCFNPRARDGREFIIYGAHSPDKLVSIHAPVMDAKGQMFLCLVYACFNPRARDGRE